MIDRKRLIKIEREREREREREIEGNKSILTNKLFYSWSSKHFEVLLSLSFVKI